MSETIKKQNVKDFQDTIDWYEQNAEHYASASEDKYCMNHINQFAKLLKKGDVVLDAGCAAGRDSNLLAKKGFQVIGVDITRNLLAIAKKKYPEIKFIHCDFRKLPFKDEFFDGVLAYASLLHFETVKDVCDALREFYRVLKDNGVICIFVKAKTGDKKTAVVFDVYSKHDRFFQYFTKSELNSLLEKCKFSVISIAQFNELDFKPNKGRTEIDWILAIARKR